MLLGLAPAGLMLAGAPAATAHKTPPTIKSAACLAAADCDSTGAAKRGRKLQLRGTGFHRGATVLFRGGRGRADNVVVRAVYRGRRTAEVRVPAAARSGLIAARNGYRGNFGRGVRVKIEPPRPVISSARCRESIDCDRYGAVKPGFDLELRGRNFRSGAEVIFYGAQGPEDNVTAPSRLVTSRTVYVRVPEEAKSGRIAMRPPTGRTSRANRYVKVGPPMTSPAESGAYAFPVRGPHNYGGSQSRFGADRGGRAHRGHDVFAAAGTPLVAARGGRVYWKAYQGSGAGHYIVIHGDDKRDYVYMHMQAPAIVNKGQRVKTGQSIGRVGCTGSCSGAHLHFEMWTPHWYDGGSPFDPLPYLQRWDRAERES